VLERVCRIFEIFRSCKNFERQHQKSFESISIFGALSPLSHCFAISFKQKGDLKGLMIEFLDDETQKASFCQAGVNG